MLPRATYRLQFRNGVDFGAAADLAPYLARLGVSHLYASPLFAARPGSTHGYDITDFNRLEPELGDAAGFERMVEALRRHGLGLVLDIVPNHMATAWENRWWRDVLAHGRASRHARAFDIDWRQHGGRVLLPVLGGSYAEALQAGALRLRRHEGRPVLACFDRLFPLSPDSLALLPERAAAGAGAARKGIEIAPELLHRLLEAQHYRLAHWRASAGGLNYRRFFDINDLVGVRVEDPEVFRDVHALVLGLVREGMVDGLRLDHVDGLADPPAYLRALRAAVQAARAEGGRGEALFPIWVEKILGPGERLRPDWPVEGTTGYEFASLAAGLLVDGPGLELLRQDYARFTGDDRSFAAIAAEAKRFVLDLVFAGELGALAGRAGMLAAGDLAARDLPEESLRRALRELLVAMPVYRSYVPARPDGPDARGRAGDGGRVGDMAAIARAAEAAAAELGAEGEAPLAFLVQLLQGREAEHAAFATRFQQLSGPLMAKAVEDTAFYRYTPLLALNEVGGEPGGPPADAAEFHAANAGRLHAHPLSLLATASHDTKRGEDLRVRLALLSDCPQDFAALVRRWWAEHAPLRGGDGEAAVTPKEGWLVYQTLVGFWPEDLSPGAPEAGPRLAALRERLAAYLEKAMREAKEGSRWTDPDPVHEAAVQGFAAALLDPAVSAGFLGELHRFVARLLPAASVASLVQLVLKLTAPGVPDIYQGTELRDLSLVDPDNRRPVDFAHRAALLDAILAAGTAIPFVPEAEATKLALMHALLRLRQQQPDLFAAGACRAVEVLGEGRNCHLAFARLLPPRALLVCVPLRPLRRAAGEGELILAGTGLEGFVWRDILTGRLHGRVLRLRSSGLLRELPVAVLAGTAAEDESI